MSKNTAYTLGIILGLILGIGSGCFFFYYTDTLLVITDNKVFSDYISWSPLLCLLIPIFFSLYYGIKAGSYLKAEYSLLTRFMIFLKLLLEILLVVLVQWLIVFITAIIIRIVFVDPIIFIVQLVAVLLIAPLFVILTVKIIDLL